MPNHSNVNSPEILFNWHLGDYSCLRGTVHLKRQIGHYVVKCYIPSIIIVFASFVSFWVPVTAIPARITLVNIIIKHASLFILLTAGNHSTSGTDYTTETDLSCEHFVSDCDQRLDHNMHSIRVHMKGLSLLCN